MGMHLYRGTCEGRLIVYFHIYPYIPMQNGGEVLSMHD